MTAPDAEVVEALTQKFNFKELISEKAGHRKRGRTVSEGWSPIEPGRFAGGSANVKSKARPPHVNLQLDPARNYLHRAQCTITCEQYHDCVEKCSRVGTHKVHRCEKH